MLDALKEESPVDTGELKKNIRIATNIKTKKGRYTIDVGVTAKGGASKEVIARGYYQHYGSRGRAGTYWMNEGFNKGIKPSKQKMAEVLRKELK